MKGDSVQLMGKKSQYDAGRLDGLELGLRIAETDGIEALRKECRMRGAWNLNLSLMTKDVDKITETLKEICYQTMMVAWVSVLHDEFGFGQVRCQRAVNKFMKLTTYLMHGWMYWYDVIEETKERLNLTMDVSAITEDHMGSTYRHPEAEDVYTEQDLIDVNEWKAILRRLHFSEGDDNWILDENGDRILHYDNKFQQIQAFDWLSGMELAKDHWEIP